MQVGEVIVYERTFTEADIRLFGQLSGDEGVHHVTPDEQGRLMVQGLLTATVPTKIGGDLNFIAREMNYQFLRPVFAGDTVRCEATITQLEPTERSIRLSLSWVCRNQHGQEVMTGHVRGVVRQPSAVEGPPSLD